MTSSINFDASLHTLQPCLPLDPHGLRSVVARMKMVDDGSRPLSLCLVLDVSGSMGERSQRLARGVESLRFLLLSNPEEIAKLPAAVQSCFPVLKPTDRIGVVTFNDDADVTVPTMEVGSEGAAIVMARLRALRAGGSTDIEAGLNAALQLMQTETGRFIVIVQITDGQDTTHFGSRVKNAASTKALKEAKDGRVLVTACIGHDADADVMSEIAEAASGIQLSVDDRDANNAEEGSSIASVAGSVVELVKTLVRQHVETTFTVMFNPAEYALAEKPPATTAAAAAPAEEVDVKRCRVSFTPRSSRSEAIIEEDEGWIVSNDGVYVETKRVVMRNGVPMDVSYRMPPLYPLGEARSPIDLKLEVRVNGRVVHTMTKQLLSPASSLDYDTVCIVPMIRDVMATAHKAFAKALGRKSKPNAAKAVTAGREALAPIAALVASVMTDEAAQAELAAVGKELDEMMETATKWGDDAELNAVRSRGICNAADLRRGGVSSNPMSRLATDECRQCSRTTSERD